MAPSLHSSSIGSASPLQGCPPTQPRLSARSPCPHRSLSRERARLSGDFFVSRSFASTAASPPIARFAPRCPPPRPIRNMRRSRVPRAAHPWPGLPRLRAPQSGLRLASSLALALALTRAPVSSPIAPYPASLFLEIFISAWATAPARFVRLSIALPSSPSPPPDLRPPI
jgi:hypothetical protein